MNKRKLTTNKLIVALTFGLIFGFGADVKADHRSDVVRAHADKLQCAADNLRDEFKSHFKGTRKYGKLISLNAQIKSRAAAVERRVKRDPCYRTMDRDLKKLSELSCELAAVFEEALVLNARCEGRPIKGDTIHVTEQIVNVKAIVECMVAASHSNVVAPPGHLVPVPVHGIGY